VNGSYRMPCQVGGVEEIGGGIVREAMV